MKLTDFPRLELAVLPTPLQSLPRLASDLGLERLYVKRDDLTGIAFGGNKARKLEYLLADAKKQGADVIYATGAWQSNHIRMTAAACNMIGIKCELFIPRARIPEEYDGNLLLDVILGAKIHFAPMVDFYEITDYMEQKAQEAIKSGRKPYIVPMGGSTPIGALGYVSAAKELTSQLKEINAENADIVVATGSGGTYSGLSVGAQMYLPKAKCIGVSILNLKSKADEIIKKEAQETAELLDYTDMDFSKINIVEDYIGKAYGIPTDACKEMILRSARLEGLLLDPTYTGKAMAGLADLAAKGIIGNNRPVVFLHTGGLPLLHAHKYMFQDLAKDLSDVDESKFSK